MTGSPTKELAQFAQEVRFDDLPDEVVEKTKRVLLDSIGCALAGTVVDRGKIGLEFTRDMGGEPQGTVIGHQKTSWVLAAFANAELINALDFDAGGPLTNHVISYVLSPSLAMAEKSDSSGKDLIVALAVAMEIGGRVGASLMPRRILKKEPPFYEDAPRYSFTSTIFGAVAGSGKLLGLGAEKTAHAFGIAGASTPVPAGQKWQRITGPVIMTKYNCWCGWVAQLATTAALFAERGFTGDTTILDGEWGFWKFYGSPTFNADKLTSGLGTVWNVGKVLFKAYPIVGPNHVAVELIAKMVEENGIRVEEIDAILVKGDPIALEPNRLQTEVTSAQDTQFCNAYTYALAATPHGRKPGAHWQLPSTYRSPQIQALMKKVKVEPHPKAEELSVSRIKAGKSPLFDDVIVEIAAKGKRFTAEGAVAKGLGGAFSDEDLKEKFRDNACYSMVTTANVEEIIRLIFSLEKIDHVSDLMRLLRVE